MPNLTYAYPDFVPFTKIKSAEVNSKFTSVQAMFNNTNRINRSAVEYGTVNHVVINAADGALSSEASLATVRGGLGFSLTVTTVDVEKVLRVNSGGTGLTLDSVPAPAGVKVFNFYRFA